MFYSPYLPVDLLYALVVLLIVATVVLLVILLVRLMLAATRALNAVTLERTVRLDLLLADDSGDDADGSTPA
jgi:hypothetical protein